jgi:ABC-type multidrug transport system fused ATPase/permease subunit
VRSIIKKIIPLEVRQTFDVLSPNNVRFFLVLIGLTLIASGLEAVGVSLVFGLIKLISAPGEIQAIPALEPLRQFFNSLDFRTLILFASIAIAVFYSIKNLFLAFNYYVTQWYLENISVQTSSRLMSAYFGIPYIQINQRNSSELIQNIYSLSQSLSGAILGPLTTLISECFVMIAIIGVLLLVNSEVTIVTLCVFGLSIIVMHSVLRRYYLSLSQRSTEGSKLFLKKTQESLGSIKELKVLQREAHFLNQFEVTRKYVARPRVHTVFIGQLPRFVAETLMVVVLSVVIGTVITLDYQIDEIIPIIGLYAFAGFRLLPSVNRILADLGKIKTGSIEVSRIYEDLRAFDQYPISTKLSGSKDGSVIQFQNNVVFRNVSYEYPSSQQKALQNISFQISRHQSVGIIGQSGSGKTTLADILLGLLAPTAGTIEVDGLDISNKLESWRRNVGYVPQEVFFIDDTLRRNIAFGIADDEIDEGRIQKAVHLAALRSVVEELPNDLDTVLQEHGSRLSGGQRQRIGIARALYHDPEVLILDEATSALDNETEREIVDALKRLAGSKTIFVIAHRLNMVRDCDLLLMFKNGSLIAKGTYAELKNSNVDFSRLIQHSGDPID